MSKLPSFKERLAMGFSGAARSASPGEKKKKSEHDVSSDDTVSTSTDRTKQKRGSAATPAPAVVAVEEAAPPKGPVLVELLQAAQHGPFKPGRVSRTAFLTWLARFGQDTNGVLQTLQREGLVAAGEQDVRITGVDSLSLAESDAVLLMWQDSARLDDGAGVEGLLRNAYRDDRTAFAPALLSLLSEADLARLVRRLVKRRLTDTPTPSELFRIDGPDTGLLFEWAKRECCGFVGSLLGPTVEHVLQMAPAFEVDPRAMQYPLMREGNLLHLRHLCEVMFASFTAPAPNVADGAAASGASGGAGVGAPIDPVARFKISPLLQHFARIVYDESAAKFGAAVGETAVMAFAVLRMLSPAVIFPEKFGLCTFTPSSAQRRALLLVAKLLQGIANGDRLGEPVVECSDLVTTFHEPLKAFLLGVLIGGNRQLPTLSAHLEGARKHSLATCLRELGRGGATAFKDRLAGVDSEVALSLRRPEDALFRFVHRCECAAKLADDGDCVTEKETFACTGEVEVLEHLVRSYEIARELRSTELMCHLRALLEAGNAFGNSVFQSKNELKPSIGSTESEEAKGRRAQVLKTLFEPK